MALPAISKTNVRVVNTQKMRDAYDRIDENVKPDLSNVLDLGNGLEFEAFADRILVLEDEFRSGYECTDCGGATKKVCSQCGGEGHYINAGSVEVKCSECGGDGRVTCPTCGGKGGLLITPEVSARRPASGKIVSVGPGVYQNGVLIPMRAKVGQSVLYSNFAGYVVDLARAGQPITIRILHENEILCGIKGHLTLTNFKGKNDIAQYNP